MKIIIEIEKVEEIEKIKKALKGETITIVKVQRSRGRKSKNRILEALFKKHNVKLPKNYSSNREAIHAR